MPDRRPLDRILARLLSPRLGYLPSRWPETLYIHVRERALEGDLSGVEYLTSLLRTEDPASLASLIDAATIGHTAVYRHPEQFEQLRATLVELAEARSGPVKIWCAGCSTGEEAYSVAHTAQSVGAHVSVLATDVNPLAIAVARSGQLPARSFSSAPVSADWAQGVPDALRRSIRFEVSSLVGVQPALGAGPFDIIFCRNVLIYFEREQIPSLVARLAVELVAEGCLVVAPVEGVLPLPPWMRRGPVAGWLQRPRDERPVVDDKHAPLSPSGESVVPPPVVLRRWRRLAGALVRAAAEPQRSGDKGTSSVPPELAAGADPLEEAAQLLSAGRAAEAEQALSALLNDDPEQLSGWFLLGEALLARGERAQARTAFLRAARCTPREISDVDIDVLRRAALRRADAL